MWNSPQAPTEQGKRYTFEDLRALTFALDRVLAALDLAPVPDVVDELILQRMEKPELVYAIYEVLQAMLGEEPAPPRGHPGYMEAIVAELLHQTHDCVVAEIEFAEGGLHARRATWTSYRRLCAPREAAGNPGPGVLERLGLDPRDSGSLASPRLTPEIWEDMLVGDGGLQGEFLWDVDWRMEFLMDVPRAASHSVTDLAGIDLELVHRLPHAPTAAEARMAEQFIRYVVLRDEVLEQNEEASS